MKFGRIIKIVSVVVALIIASLISYNLYFVDWFDGNSNLGVDKSLLQDNYSVREEPAPGEVRIIPTADPRWNLYRNFKYGFQIQYPAEWEFIKIYKTSNTGDVFIGFSPSGVDSMIGFSKSNNQSLESVLNKVRNNDRYVDDKKVFVNDKEMIKVFNRNPYLDYDSYGYIFQNGNDIYSLSGGGLPQNSWYIDRMIETLEVF